MERMKNTGLSKAKLFAKDSAWSIAALCLMNAVLQFLLYPVLRQALGQDGFGQVQYLLGIISIIAVTIGSSVNYAHIVSSTKGRVHNTDSLIWLIGASVLLLPVCFGVLWLSGMVTSLGRFLLFWTLTVLTVWRYFGDVEYRLTTNYRGYFLYYLFISIGYGGGIFLYRATGLWELMILPGECLGLAFVALNGRVLRFDSPLNKARFGAFAVSTGNLTLSHLLGSVVLSGDRLVLQNAVGGEAVTVYYVSSLIGKTMALLTTPFNSVLIGHLVKRKERLRGGQFLKLSLLGLLVAAVMTGLTVAGSYIVIPLLYPDDFAQATYLFLLANAAQVIYFTSNILMVVLIRYLKAVYQVIINTVYVGVFFAVSVAATIWWGVTGFAVALLITNAVRYAFVTLLGVCKLNRPDETQSDEALADGGQAHDD